MALLSAGISVESSVVQAFSDAGAWGMTALVLFWYARQREKDNEAFRAREERLTTEIRELQAKRADDAAALQAKRAEDIAAYGIALRSMLDEQNTAFHENARALNGVRELLEMMRAEGYILKRASAQPASENTQQKGSPT